MIRRQAPRGALTPGEVARAREAGATPTPTFPVPPRLPFAAAGAAR